MLIDLHRRHWRDLKRCQQLHNIPHGAAFRVARFDLLQFLFRDAADLQELFRMIFQHIERICAEPLDMLLAVLSPMPLRSPDER